MGALEPPHLIIILILVLVIFGPGKLPQLGKAIGDGIRELKHATNEENASTQGSSGSPSPTAASPTTETTRSCPHCKAVMPVSARFCGTCGRSLETAASTSSNTRSSVL